MVHFVMLAAFQQSYKPGVSPKEVGSSFRRQLLPKVWKSRLRAARVSALSNFSRLARLAGRARAAS